VEWIEANAQVVSAWKAAAEAIRCIARWKTIARSSGANARSSLAAPIHFVGRIFIECKGRISTTDCARGKSPAVRYR
jgi:hypothetical protein